MYVYNKISSQKVDSEYVGMAFSLFRHEVGNCYYLLQRPHKATAEEITKYHSDDYIQFLQSIRPDNMSEYSKQMQRCKSSHN